MILRLVSIWDRKLEEYKGLYLTQNVAVAARMFGDALASDTEYAKHPDDFRLDMVGSFDTETGMLENLSQKVVIIEAAALARDRVVDRIKADYSQVDIEDALTSHRAETQG